MNSDQGNNPNRDPARNARQDEAFVQRRLDLLASLEPMDPQFIDQLSHQLDAEFASVKVGVAKTSGADVIESCLEEPEPVVGEHVLSRSRSLPDPSDVGSAPAKHKRKLPRWLGGVVAAAVVLGMFAFWTAQPLTSWAEMIEALKNAPWVQTDSGRMSSWFSASNQIVARRDANQSVFASRSAGTRLSYVREDARIYQTNADDLWRPLDRDLIAWLARSADVLIDPDSNWTIVSESVRRVDDAAGRWLKLAVVFESSQPVDQVFTAVFTVDPKTKMPVSCHVREGAFGFESTSDRNGWQSVSFDYPTDGPTDIFDLGVAADMPIDLSRFDSQAGLVSTNVPPDREPLLADRLAKMEPIPALKPPKASDLAVQPKEQKTKTPDPATAKPKSPKANDATAAVVAKQTEPVSIAPEAFATPTTLTIIPIPAASVAMTSRVDQLVDELWIDKEVLPAEQTTDEAFLRRVFLDVIGRVPTIGEYDQFFELDVETRRSELIDELLDSREHALHMGGIWKRVLVPDDETAISRLGGSGKLEQWLSDAFANNQPYDELVRELLLAEGRVNESGPLLFYAAAKMNAEELAARTSRTFLGMRMECAECHDHPFDHWSQKDFWGLAAYFAQISRPQGKIEMVSPVLRVRDADFGDVKLPETEFIVQPKLPVSLSETHGMTSADIVALKEAEITDGSRREQLAVWITHPQNSHFAQATVNRIWAHLFGRGIVDPVDDMGGHNLPTSPQLMNQLGRYFVQSDFDLRALMRVLLNSRAYQLSSENRDESASRDELYFARMPLKPLTAEQLYDCLATATGRTDLGSQVIAPMAVNIASNVDRFSDPGRAAFLAQFRTSLDQRTDYQAGIPQALTLMNGPMIASATADAPKGILRSLSAPFFNDETRIEKLFVATLSRRPTDDEKKRYANFIGNQPADTQKSETLGDVLWVLLNSTEFTMNH